MGRIKGTKPVEFWEEWRKIKGKWFVICVENPERETRETANYCGEKLYLGGF